MTGFHPGSEVSFSNYILPALLRECTVINLRAWASNFRILNVKLERSLLI